MTRARKACRGGDPCEPITLAEALCCEIQHAAVDIDVLAARLSETTGQRVTRAFLYELSTPHHPAPRSLAIAAVLGAATGRGVLLRFLCRQGGGSFVARPASLGDVAIDQVSLVAAALREFSEAMQAFADGGADRVWTPAEVERLAREGDEAVERILQLVAYARHQVQLPAKAAAMVKASLDTAPVARVAQQ